MSRTRADSGKLPWLIQRISSTSGFLVDLWGKLTCWLAVGPWGELDVALTALLSINSEFFSQGLAKQTGSDV
jgi:hypothetical protein